MASKDIRDTFRRNVRDRFGEIVRTLEFPKATPVELSWEDLPHVQRDLYHALNPVEVCPKGKITIIEKEDFDRIMSENALEAATAPEVSGGENAGRRSRR